MNSSLDDIDWLTRSKNRVRLLTVLESGAYDRATLQGELGVARITLNRTIAEFDEKGWIHREKSQYTASPLGDLIASDLSNLLETATTVRELREHRNVFQRLC